MILKLQNVITNTSFGDIILQMDKDKIISVEPQEEIKQKQTVLDPNLSNNYFEGLASELIEYYIELGTVESTIKIVFSDLTSRNNAIHYIFDEMRLKTNEFRRIN